MPFPLLSLPPELRNAIYLHALVSPFTLLLTHPRPYPSHPPPPPRWRPTVSLLRTCHLIHAEATPLLYGETMFAFNRNRAYNTLIYFLTHISPASLTHIRRLVLPWPARQVYLSSPPEGDREILMREVVARGLETVAALPGLERVMFLWEGVCETREVDWTFMPGNGWCRWCFEAVHAVKRWLGGRVDVVLFPGDVVEEWDLHFGMLRDLEKEGWRVVSFGSCMWRREGERL